MLANENDDPGNLVRLSFKLWEILQTSHLALEVEQACGESAVETTCEMMDIVFPRGNTDMEIAQQACRVLLAALDRRYAKCTFDCLVFKEGMGLKIEAQSWMLCNGPFRRLVCDYSGGSVSIGSTERIADDTILAGRDHPPFALSLPMTTSLNLLKAGEYITHA
jgi:hypothetical protein